jgi:hypothetical protein
MSTHDALPTEIALIALLFVQVTSLFNFPPSLLPQANHSFHVPIALSVNSTPHGIDQHPAITYQEVLCPQDWHPTHTQYSLTQP